MRLSRRMVLGLAGGCGLALAGYSAVDWRTGSDASGASADDGAAGYGNETSPTEASATVESGVEMGADDAGAEGEQTSGGGTRSTAVNPSANDGTDTGAGDDEAARGYGRDPYGHPV